MVKIYTKKGDGGETFLACGKLVSKGCARLAAYGSVDELNAVLGLCREENEHALIGRILRRLQGELFTVGADLATTKISATRVSAKMVTQLEKDIDAIEANLPKLKNFILPAGGDAACFLHLARTVCRRAERSVVALAEGGRAVRHGRVKGRRGSRREKINPLIIVYLNRLSDLLFVMARLANRSEKIKEEKWGD